MTWEDATEAAVYFWSSRDGKSWQLEFRLVEIDGRMECVGIDIRSLPDEGAAPAALLASTLRELPFAGVLTRARRDKAQSLARLGDQWAAQAADPAHTGPTWRRLNAMAADMAQEKRDAAERIGRAKYSRADLVYVAELYSAAYASGSASPTKDVADKLGISRNIAAKRVMRCRDPKVALLAPTRQSKAGGILPPAPKEADR
jgi:hypothetical protein